jgi:hypothetical protein
MRGKLKYEVCEFSSSLTLVIFKTFPEEAALGGEPYDQKNKVYGGEYD